MDSVIAVALRSMQRDSVRVDKVGINLANALTPAYKREVVVEHPFTQFMEDGTSGKSTEKNVVSSSMNMTAPTSESVMEVHIDNRPGTLKTTGQSLDLALGSVGYFEVA